MRGSGMCIQKAYRLVVPPILHAGLHCSAMSYPHGSALGGLIGPAGPDLDHAQAGEDELPGSLHLPRCPLRNAGPNRFQSSIPATSLPTKGLARSVIAPCMLPSTGCGGELGCLLRNPSSRSQHSDATNSLPPRFLLLLGRHGKGRQQPVAGGKRRQQQQAAAAAAAAAAGAVAPHDPAELGAGYCSYTRASLAAMSARLLTMAVHCAFFRPLALASASARAPFVMAFFWAPAAAFFIAGAIFVGGGREIGGRLAGGAKEALRQRRSGTSGASPARHGARISVQAAALLPAGLRFFRGPA